MRVVKFVWCFPILITYTDWNFPSIFSKYYRVHRIWPSLKLVLAGKTKQKLIKRKKNWLKKKNKASIHLGLLRGSLYIKWPTSTQILIVEVLIGPFFTILMFLRRFHHTRMKYTILIIGRSFYWGNFLT